ncbi:hypothetical protein BOW53_13540 [Solemya pervernicosa gill symbiont]|uniref:Lipo-like protein n=1 Tax=Solemya pervernicosa gill symbiont TaxID=642797 RepID=A0A1T2L1V2_9GAMM|nr:hypothetical protein BOW53_13540 [Solemya pervernicosa gill symbiont]
MCNFDQLHYEIRPCDVLLVEGRSRISDVIKNITLSNWTHSALYIGSIHDLEAIGLADKVTPFYDGDPHEPLVLEALLGKGTVITPLEAYRGYHLRICRPKGLVPEDVRQVLAFSVDHLGRDYDVRQLIDMARFFYPYALMPKRWRSSLFQHKPGGHTRTICSTLIASAFMAVQYPILPVVVKEATGHIHFFKRNARLFTPNDFDHSPYFEIIKYPLLGLDDMAHYRRLPWRDDLVCNNPDDCYDPASGDPVEATDKRMEERHLHVLGEP